MGLQEGQEAQSKPGNQPRKFGNVVREDGTMANLVTKKGRTRGKNPRDIEYQAFDLEQPDSLPKSMAEFSEVTKVTEEKDFLELLIAGFNDSQYSAASDEIGEYVQDYWDKDYQNQFRLTVRNFSKISGKTIEETVDMLKMAIDAGWDKRVAEKKAAADLLASQPAATQTPA